jgi:hypothetical protein
MSFTLPPNTTLQLSSTIGDINHQGIQSSNINGTEILPAFPTTSTGTSTGNYNHLGIDGQNNNKWDFLNASGTLDGGYNFWHSSDAHAPLLVTSIDDTGLTIDRSTTINNPSYNTYDTIITGPNYIVMAHNPSGDPEHWVLQQMYIIQVGNNTATMSTGVNYNVKYADTQLVTVHTTSDPNSPIIDSTGITSVLIPDGSTPVVTTKTAILTSEALFIKNDPFFSPVALSTNGLSLSDTSDNNSYVAPGLITVQDSSSYNTQVNAYSFNINGNAKTVAINSDNMTITDATSNNSILSSSSLIFNSYYNAGVPLNIIDISGTTIQINDNDQGISSTLTSGELSLNDGSNNTQIYPQLINLNGNGIASSLSPTNLTFNGRSYAQNQVVPTLIYSSPIIYADGHEPATSLAIRNTYGYSGWYFKNSPPNTAPTNKINWYFPPCNANITTVSDLKGISISFFNGNTTSNDNTLFLTVLTVPTGSNDYAPGFYHSANTYVFNQSITPIANTNYQGVAIVDKQYVPFNYETQIQFQPSTVNNPKGTYSQGDKILAVVIGTNSASATNSVELVVNKLNLIYSNFTQSYLLIPP